jgi:hypothetical protein
MKNKNRINYSSIRAFVDELRKSFVSKDKDVFQPWNALHVSIAAAELDLFNFEELPEVVRSSLLQPRRDVHLGKQPKS